jgi:outer membrane protein assembly factor BamB
VLIVMFILCAIYLPPAENGGMLKASFVDETAFHSYHSCYNQFELKEYPYVSQKDSGLINLNQKRIQWLSDAQISRSSNKGPLDSPWPMMSRDVSHTGRSPYNTTQSPEGVEIWRFCKSDSFDGGVVIDDTGTLFFGCMDCHVYAAYPNGTMKWKTNLYRCIEATPAIDANGILYIGTIWNSNCLFALYLNNGTLKWSYPAGDIDSSPAIAEDGTIYFGDWNGWVHALHPDGTVKWKYHTGDVITGSPAIGPDGTVYIGSHDSSLYAFYPDNGTVRWRFYTGGWVRVSPCVGDDGTVYCVSFDNYLYAIYPNNGTMKWRTFVNAGTNPTIGSDGTIYAGWNILYAINPFDGSEKWNFTVNGYIEGGTPCTSKEGIIYLGTSAGSELIAINPDGTLRWRHHIGVCQSPPAIDSNGWIYIGSESPGAAIHAFGQGPLRAEANGPYSETANNSIQFTGDGFGGIPPYTYHWDFGDNHSADEQNPRHSYTHAGVYNAVFTVTDSQSNQSSDNATVTINYPPPLITLRRPTNGIYFFDRKILPFKRGIIAIGPLTVEANVTENPLPIVRVDFLIDGEVRGTVTTPPYKWVWIKLNFGYRTLCAKAYDSIGNKRFSEVYGTWKFF